MKQESVRTLREPLPCKSSPLRTGRISKIHNIVREVSQLLTACGCDSIGILYADDPFTGEDKLRLYCNGLSCLQGRSEFLSKDWEFIQFQTDPMSDKLCLLSRISHEFVSQTCRLRNSGSTGIKVLAYCIGPCVFYEPRLDIK